MNPYRKGGLRTPRARRSFDPAYCKRSAARPSVNDGYMGPPRSGRAGQAGEIGPAARRWPRPPRAPGAAPAERYRRD